MLERLLLPLCFVALLPATTPVWAKEAAPVTVDAGFKPAEQAEQLVEMKDRQWAQGLKRVAVTQFAVEFVTYDAQSASTSAFGGRSASVTARWALSGVSEPDFQALADAFLVRFQQDLAASGLEVVPTAEVQASPTWKKFAADGKAYPQRSDVSVSVAPPGMVQYGAANLEQGATTQNQRGNIFGSVLATVQGISAVTSVLASHGERVQLQKELGGAGLLEVKMQVHFVDLVDNNRGFLGRMAGSASVTGTVYPSIRQGSVFLHRDAAVQNLLLKAPLRLDGQVFTSIKDQTATADGERWRAVVGSGLATAGQLVVERLRAAR